MDYNLSHLYAYYIQKKIPIISGFDFDPHYDNFAINTIIKAKWTTFSIDSYANIVHISVGPVSLLLSQT